MPKQSDLALNPVVIRQHKELQEKNYDNRTIKSTTKGGASLSSGWVFKPGVHGASAGKKGYSRKSLACPMTAQALQNTWRNFRFRVSVIMDEKGLEAAGYDVLCTMTGKCTLRRNPFCISSFRDLRNELSCCDRGGIKRP